VQIKDIPHPKALEPDADGWVIVDNTGRASVPGVWAAGNIVDPRAQ
jgi:thioredoxin reductase